MENNIAETVLELVRDRSTPDATLDSTFDDLGMDSLDRVELELEIEEEFNVTVQDGDVDKIKTVRQLAEFVSALKSEEVDGSPVG